MARLNEAPPPAESVDQLKRRFIRQNRELAKNNSAQSVRIRALETEQARILAENLALREQIIHLQTELEHSSGHNAVQQITSVKDKLESKLLEIGGLVAELNSIQKPSHKKRSSDTGPSRATEHYEWRRAMKEQAGDEEDDDILPTIREGKYFPRRTLDTEELRTVLTDAAEDSPDLGPPPVSHFTDEDPIKFDPKPVEEIANDDMDVDQKEEEALPAALSVNLETRKKRRDSSKLDLRKMSVFQSPEEDSVNKAVEDVEPLKSKMGRKRKLSATVEDTNTNAEAGERDTRDGPDDRDDFRFSRRSNDRENRQPSVTSTKQNNDIEEFTDVDRVVLGDKTNTSPQKVQKSDSKSDAKKSAPSKESARNRVKERKARASLLKIPPPEMKDVVSTADIPVEEPHKPEQPELPPKTPAGLELFSPMSTEPSAARQELKDTPPPGDLATSGNTDASAGGRPSRRARSQVNYAEPNLISKMRRPDKSMVDAVVDSRRSLDPQPDQSRSETNSTNPMRTVVIKKERPEDANSAWKALPASSEQHEPHSPLSNKTAAAQLASESQTKVAEDKGADERNFKPTKSATAVKDLLSSSTAGVSRRRATAKSSSADSADLDIFELNITDSSPADQKDASSTNGRNSDDIMKSSRALVAKSAAMSSSRRHSSVMSTSANEKERGSTGTAPPKTVSFSDEVARSKSTRDSRQAKGSSTAAPAEGRAERSSTRRRSMML